MVIMSGEPEITPYKKLCTTLQSNQKQVRKQALIDFQNLLTNTKPELYHGIFKESHIHLLNMLRDNSEPVREQAIKFTKFFIVDTLPKNDFYLSYLFPVLIERIGTVELVEESEEIRLQLVQLLQQIVDKYNEESELKQFLNDFTIILRETVRDKYPAIKEASCKLIVSLAKVLPRDFHMQAESLVQPVLTAFNHQRYKIRVEAIKCMGELVMHSQYKALEDCVGPMAERLFDSVPLVRRTVAQVAARWLLEYRDRYSFFHKLLPLILTGLNDEVPETRTESHKLWAEVGLQYQKENEKDLKDRMDYLTEPPLHYPDLERPNLGCRVLVQTTVGKLTGALARELTSWQADVRVRCSQLLCAVALHAEEFLTQHLQDLLSAMYMGAKDEDQRVVVNVKQASEIMGIFIPVDTWKKLILPAIEEGPNYGHFLVLCAFIKGSPQENIMSSLREISQLLAEPFTSHSRKMLYQRELMNCVEAIESKYDVELSDDIGQYLFNTIVTILSICDKENESTFHDSLPKLCKTLQIEDEADLWQRYIPSLLKIIGENPKSWTVVTIERCIFGMILENAGEAFGENLDAFGKILVETLDVEADAESRLITLTSLSKAFDNKDVIFKRAVNLEDFLFEKVLRGVLIKTLVWHAGRTAEAMRTMAASCLLSVLNPGKKIIMFEHVNILRPVVDELMPLLISLLEDASYHSRFLALENLVLLKKNMDAKDCWMNDDLIKIYPEFLKRLDDPIDQVRFCAIKSLKDILESCPAEFKGPTYKPHHELLFDTLLTHFDDDDQEFQNIVKDALLNLLPIAKEVGRDKLEKHKPLLKNQLGCDLLLNSIDTIP